MAAITNRYVVRRENGNWDVVKDGDRRASAQVATREEAVKAARRLIRRDGGGEVQVMNQAGKIVESDTVKRTRARQGR
jgi:Uncharacterized protein conserved in bacteria (DUF2188)